MVFHGQRHFHADAVRDPHPWIGALILHHSTVMDMIVLQALAHTCHSPLNLPTPLERWAVKRPHKTRRGRLMVCHMSPRLLPTIVHPNALPPSSRWRIIRISTHYLLYQLQQRTPRHLPGNCFRPLPADTTVTIHLFVVILDFVSR